MKIDEKHRRDVLTGNLWKVVIVVTAPLFLYQLISQFYNLIDQSMVSTISSQSVAAVAAVSQIKNLLSSLGGGLAAGGAILVARSYGAGNLEKARKNANVMFTMALIVSLIMLLLMPFSNSILRLSKVPEDLISISTMYFRLQLIELGIMLFNSIFIALERAKCNTKIIFIGNIIIMAVKICLNVMMLKW